MTKRIALAAAAMLAACAPAITPPASSATTAAADGRQVFNTYCLQCHSSTTNDAKVGPGLKGLFKTGKMPASGTPVTDASVRNQILKGGNGMPGFEGTIEAADLDALIAYLKTL